jgi:hypothetical protein
MAQAEIAQAVQLLDLTLEHFADDATVTGRVAVLMTETAVIASSAPFCI